MSIPTVLVRRVRERPEEDGMGIPRALMELIAAIANLRPDDRDDFVVAASDGEGLRPR
ncbi:hypothetical protein GCM10009739_22100 [Microbacterium ulmi]